jgi:hypothetical protein
MNRQARVLLIALVAGSLVLGIVVWGREPGGSPATLLPILAALAMVGAGFAKKRREREGDARRELPPPLRLLLLTVAVALPVGIMLWNGARKEAVTAAAAAGPAPAAPADSAPWIVLAVIVALAVLMVLMRTLRRDKDREVR